MDLRVQGRMKCVCQSYVLAACAPQANLISCVSPALMAENRVSLGVFTLIGTRAYHQTLKKRSHQLLQQSGCNQFFAQHQCYRDPVNNRFTQSCNRFQTFGRSLSWILTVWHHSCVTSAKWGCAVPTMGMYSVHIFICCIIASCLTIWQIVKKTVCQIGHSIGHSNGFAFQSCACLCSRPPAPPRGTGTLLQYICVFVIVCCQCTCCV